MSLLDFQQGVGAGNRAAAGAIDEWETHANSLKRRLRYAETEANQANAGRAGMAYLINQLANELKKYAPNHPLLDLNNRVAIVEDAANKISSGTHTYEPKTGTLKPVQR